MNPQLSFRRAPLYPFNYQDKRNYNSIRGERRGAILDSGQCGDNLNWQLYDDGTLEIYGTGKMWNYVLDIYQAPWAKEHSSELKSLIIGDGVSSIGYYAFYNCSGLSGTPPLHMTRRSRSAST